MTRALRLHTPQSLIIVGMLLTQSEVAEELRSNIIDSIFRIDEKKELVMELYDCKDSVRVLTIAKRLEEIKEAEVLAIENIKQVKLITQIELDAPKIDVFERFINTDRLYTTTQLVNILKIDGIRSAKAMHKKLNELHICYKQWKTWVAYADTDRSLFEVKVNEFGSQLKWTPEGIVKIADLFDRILNEEELNNLMGGK